MTSTGGDPQRIPEPEFLALLREVRVVVDTLIETLTPHLFDRSSGTPGPIPAGYPELLWWLMKALAFAAPDGRVPGAEYFEMVADDAATAVRDALRLAAGRLSPATATAHAKGRILAGLEDVGTVDILDVQYTPPDRPETMRTLRVRLTVDPDRPLVEVLGSTHGQPPTPRPASAADVLRLGAALETIAEILSQLVGEPLTDGLPTPGVDGATDRTTGAVWGVLRARRPDHP